MKTMIAVAALLLTTPAMAATAVPAVPVTPAAATAATPAGQARQGVFEKADANHDGIVTKAEFLASEGAYFDTVDTDHDGKLTQDEVKASRDKSRARRMAWKQEHAVPAAPAK